MAWLAGWNKRIELAIDKDQIDALLSNFPIMVRLSASSGISNADVSFVFDELGSDANRKRIAITLPDGVTECYVEIERWDHSNEKAILHVEIAGENSVSPSADTVPYLYYDANHADNDAYVGDTTDAVTHNVWDDDGVWHMAQDPNGDGAGAIKDSTSNANDGTPAGTMLTEDLVDGKVGKAIDFDGGDDAIGFGDILDMGTNDLTLMAIIKTTKSSLARVVNKREDAPGGDGYELWISPDGKLMALLGGAAGSTYVTADSGTTVNDNVYHLLTAVYDRSGNMSTYVDDTFNTSLDISDESAYNVQNALDLTLGGIDSEHVEDIIDEFRVVLAARSAPWIKATYHSLWDSLITFGEEEIRLGTIEDAVTVADAISGEAVFNPAVLTEGVSITDEMTVEGDYPDQGVSIDDAISAETNYGLPALTETVTIADEILAGSVFEAPLTEAATVDDETLGEAVFDAPLAEVVTISDQVDGAIALAIEETLGIWETVSTAWSKTIDDTLAFTEVVDKILGIIANDPLTFEDVASSNWNGTEEIGSTLQMIGAAIVIEVFNETNSETLTITDVPTYLHQMISAIADTLGFTEGVTVAPEFYSEIVDSLAITGIVEVLTALYNTNSETLTLTDTLGVGWDKDISDTLALTDTVTPTFYAMIALTDSIAFTESVLGQFEINENIADTIGFATALALQRILTNTIEDTISFGITIELDGELWETWVLNTNAFHASVYSGYEFNSYCVYNETAYGCKSDGIYELTGDTDAGGAFKAGIVLPETHFGTSRKKRFRKAYFGLSGGTTPAVRLETSSGSATYTIVSSKANISRSLYGRQWVLKVQDFDDLEFIELVPIILTR